MHRNIIIAEGIDESGRITEYGAFSDGINTNMNIYIWPMQPFHMVKQIIFNLCYATMKQTVCVCFCFLFLFFSGMIIIITYIYLLKLLLIQIKPKLITTDMSFCSVPLAQRMHAYSGTNRLFVV